MAVVDNKNKKEVIDIYLIIICSVFGCLSCVSCELNLDEGSSCITDGRNGTCVNIYSCESAVLPYLLNNAGFLSISIAKLPDVCSHKNNEPVVCCTDCEIKKDRYRDLAIGPQGRLIDTEGSISKKKCYEYLQKLPYGCRGNGNPMLVKYFYKNQTCSSSSYTYPLATGGRNAMRWEFPHMALIGYGDDVDSAQWLCGGSVISERFILTAAHCTSTRALGNISYAALGLLRRTDPKKYWKIYKIKRIIIHPEYNSPSKYHDIALLETETEIAFGKDLLPACLDDSTYPEWGAEAAGWGRLGHRQDLANILQVVKIDPFEESDCAAQYPPHRHLRHGYDHETQMCYGSRELIIDTCEGDSGGPLQYNRDYIRCLFHIIGVTSYGKDCGILGSAGMYTRVSYYVPWIESVVWPEETEARRNQDNQ